MDPEEIVVPFASSRSEPASELRSTLLTTSLQSLRAHGHFDAYVKLLPPSFKEHVVSVVAGVWMPIEVGLAHYRACDGLNLTPQQAFAMGKEVGDRVQGTILGLMVRTAKAGGLTPWTGLAHCQRFYERIFRGGAVSLTKLGPKEARLETVNNSLCGIPYFRHGFRGLCCAGAELFCQRVYGHDLPRLGSPTSLGVRLSWA
jgi:hypothetical protein